ncbi:F-box protein [Panicum miliaceum]|uniref:F-box protein n=1 Tax=Panicum miliaceum TaxID=4540 RepID=A0A3L6S3H1_PANMI|nr:F-box protein [Panicum miliaceum]
MAAFPAWAGAARLVRLGAEQAQRSGMGRDSRSGSARAERRGRSGSGEVRVRSSAGRWGGADASVERASTRRRLRSEGAESKGRGGAARSRRGGVQREGPATLPRLLTRSPAVSKLALKCNRRAESVDDLALALVADRLGPGLRRLKLRSLRVVTDDGVTVLAAAAGANLCMLTVGSCYFGAKGIEAVLRSCLHLEELAPCFLQQYLKIILGSSSPPRPEILTDMGYNFTVMCADIDEKAIRKGKPEELVKALAEAKAEAIKLKLHDDCGSNSYQTTLLITSDQPILHAGKGHGEQRGDTGKATECRRSQGIYQG